MLNLVKSFLKEEDGLGTIEIVIIIGVLVALALVFKKYIINFFNKIIESVFGNENQTDINEYNIQQPSEPVTSGGAIGTED